MKKCLLLVALAGCELGEVGPDGDVVTIEAKADYMKRVVIARLYQKTDWTLPALAAASPADKVAYACSVIAPRKPTYVSGLLRLDDDSPLTPDQIAVYQGMRACLPNAKLDVVLNAMHYAEPGRHASPHDAVVALKKRADEIKNVLHADIVFFDFFNIPYNVEHQKDWWHPSLTAGTDYIRDTLKMKVGGNVWGMELRLNSNFVALDNFDRNTTDGYAWDKLQIDEFRHDVPVMIHVENNPDKDKSKGLLFLNSDTAYRKGQIAKYGGDQRKEGFSYMFPVFFPLKCCAGGVCAPDRCDDKPSDRVAYDASRDGNMLQKIDEGLAQ